MAESPVLLTTRQMAQFVTDGYLRFDALVPDDINRRVLDEVARLKDERWAPDGLKPPDTGTPFPDCYPDPSALGAYLRLPPVAGMVASLVGLDCTFDHDFTHHLEAGSTYRQPLHVDAVIDSVDPAFDIQLFYFPHEVLPGEGGTRFVPGSHLRRVISAGLDRYQHIVGEEQYSGPAGTVLVIHHGMWHAGQPNGSASDRWMHKVRLNPTRPQVLGWDTSDLEALHNPPTDHIFARIQPDSVANTFRVNHRWHSVNDSRNEQIQRARLWRYLTGDQSYDVDHYLTRLRGHERVAHDA